MVPPPGAGLETVIDAVLALAISAAGTTAVNLVALLKVVARAVPFHFTRDVLTKLAPVTVRGKDAAPAVAEAGDKAVTLGAGLSMVKVRAAVEVPPPGAGLSTLTDAVPAFAIAAVGIAAVSLAEFTKVVVKAAPFQRILPPVAKLDPATVNTNDAPPAVADVGETVPNTGRGLLIVKVSALEAPPPGVGLTTVTGTAAAVVR